METTEERIRQGIFKSLVDARSVSIKSTWSSPFYPWIFNQSKSHFEIKYQINWSLFNFFNDTGHVSIEEESEIRSSISEILGVNNYQVVISATGDCGGVRMNSNYPSSNKHQVEILFTPEVFFEKLYQTRQINRDLLPYGWGRATQDLIPFKARKVLAQELVRRLNILPMEDPPKVTESNDADIFRDVELTMLGAKSSGLIFRVIGDDTKNKNYPWIKIDDFWVCKINSLDYFEDKQVLSEMAKKTQEKLREKYKTEDISVRGDRTDISVFVRGDEALKTLLQKLSNQAGIETCNGFKTPEFQKIIDLSPNREEIDCIEINIGTGGIHHSVLEDSKIVVSAGGKTADIAVKEKPGKTLRSLIDDICGTQEVGFAKTVKFKLKLATGIARAINLQDWDMHKSGIFAIPVSRANNGEAEFEIYTHNIHKAALVLAHTFRQLPKLGFGELKELQGVAEFASIQNYRA